MLENILESPLNSKEIKPVNPKWNQPWLEGLAGRTGAETEAPVIWSTGTKSQLIEKKQQQQTNKNPDAGKDWRQEKKGATKDEMVGWNYWLNGHEFEQTQGDVIKDKETWYAAVHGVANNRTQLTTEQHYPRT